MATKKLRKAKSWGDLYDLASKGPEAERWQQVIIGALRNLGAEGMAENYKHQHPKMPEWHWSYHGLQSYILCMVGEYHEPEEQAEKNVLAEVNHVRGLY